VRAHHVDELVAHAHHRVERVHCALEDHRDVLPAVAPKLLALAADEVIARKGMLPPATYAGRKICMTAFRHRVFTQPDSPRADDLARVESSGRCRRHPRARALADAVVDGEPRSSTRASPWGPSCSRRIGSMTLITSRLSRAAFATRSPQARGC